MTINLFLDGLNQIGYSLALALPKEPFDVQAFDPNGKLLRQLKRDKVLNRSYGQLSKGVRNADIIIIDQPIDFLALHYEAIGEDCKAAVIVVDTSPLPLYSAQLAEKFLPKEAALVSMVPSFNYSALDQLPFVRESGSEALFQESMVAISSPSNQFRDGEQIGARLATAVGASVMFMDPYELQEAMVKTQFLPNYVAMAVQHALMQQPSWRDEERIASSAYFQLTRPVLGTIELEHPELPALENRESLVRALDEVVGELTDLRDLIARGKASALNEYLQNAVQARIAWQEKRRQNTFGNQATGAADMPKTSDVYQNLFLGGLGRKK